MYNNFYFYNNHHNYNVINESFNYKSNDDIIAKLKEVDIFDEKTKSYIKINPEDIMKVCSDAIYKIHRDYPYLYLFFEKCKVMYIPVYPSQITNTMAVDDENNMWINMSFVYNDCKMNSDRVFGILFHEIFHIFLDHCVRFNKKYPSNMFTSLGEEGGKKLKKTLNNKSNICMDYEVNASMVDDGIVSDGFWKNMNGLYKKEYTGMTWEEIMDKYGDKEYAEWMQNNGLALNQTEEALIDAIEKAAKTLLDPNSDDDENKEARRQLQKDIEDILGKQPKTKDQKDIKDILEDLENTKLGDIGSIAADIEDVIDDLNKAPEGMDENELAKTLSDMNKLIDNIIENSDAVGEQFGKSGREVQDDARKANQKFKDAMQKINEGGLSKEEKEDLITAAKDALEDIISDENEKDRLSKERQERDEKKAQERLEKFKKNHPFQIFKKLIKNFIGLKEIDLISDNTLDVLKKVDESIEPLLVKKFSELKKSDVKDLSNSLDELKEAFYPDLVALIDNETILQKSPNDMRRLLDDVFDEVFDAFRRLFDSTLDDNSKASLIKVATQKLRIIGKVLKTQKKWKVSEDFKEGYQEEMKRLMKIFKEDGEEALFKELYDKGVIDIFSLDSKGLKLLDNVLGESSGDSDFENRANEDMKEQMANCDHDYDDVEEYKGKIYYDLYKSPDTWNDDVLAPTIELSDNPEILHDDEWYPFVKKFENDFPKYKLGEIMESVFEVYDREEYKNGKWVYADFDEIKKAIESNGDYEKCNFPE